MTDEQKINVRNEPEEAEHRQAQEVDTLTFKLIDMGYPIEHIRIAISLGILDVSQAIELLDKRSLHESYISNGSLFCLICQCKITKETLASIIECMDSFCLACLQQYIQLRIEESQVLSIPCPNYACHAELNDQTIKHLTTPALFDKYLTFKNNEELSKDPFLRFCPAPNCRGYAIGSPKLSQLSCNICNLSFCFFCGEPWHFNSKCNADRKAQQWAKSNGVKHCPNCRRRVEKNKGCDHMTCVKCRYEWCWLCGEKYTGGHHQTCEVKKISKKNPPMKKVLVMLFSPLILPFICVVFCFFVLEEVIASQRYSGFLKKLIENKVVMYPITCIIGIVLTPVFITVAPFTVSISITYKCFDSCQDSNGWNVCGALIIGIAITPLFVAGFFVFVGILHVIGVILMFWKLYIVIRRCFEPNYLLPRTRYGII